MACFHGLDQCREPKITTMDSKENLAQLDSYCRQELCALSSDKRHATKKRVAFVKAWTRDPLLRRCRKKGGGNGVAVHVGTGG